MGDLRRINQDLGITTMRLLTNNPAKVAMMEAQGVDVAERVPLKVGLNPLNEAYLDTNKWEGKAGAFGLQDRLGWVRIVEGSESNVVGLPMELLAEMLAEIGD